MDTLLKLIDIKNVFGTATATIFVLLAVRIYQLEAEKKSERAYSRQRDEKLYSFIAKTTEIMARLEQTVRESLR